VDDLLKQYLVWERPEPRFNEKSVGGFIDDFRATLKLAKLDVSDIMDSESDDEFQVNDDEEDLESDSSSGSISMSNTSVSSSASSASMNTSPLTPPPPGGAYISFPLPGGNAIEIRLRSRVSKMDFDRIKSLVELSEASLVEDTAQVSMILDRGLTIDEKAKLARLDSRLSALFSAAGYIVRVCEGRGEDKDRKIQFLVGLTGPPVFSLSSYDFLAAPDDLLLDQVKGLLTCTRDEK
jgi:hypothetical protein